MIQPIISRQHIAERNRQQKVRHALIAKQLKANEQRSNRAVGHATEYGGHTDCGAERRGESQQISEQTAKCCTGEKGWNNLAALIAGTKGSGSKNHF